MNLFKRVITQKGISGYEFYLDSGLHRKLAAAGMVLDHREEAAADVPGWANRKHGLSTRHLRGARCIGHLPAVLSPLETPPVRAPEQGS